jgi:hypothetical protein
VHPDPAGGQVALEVVEEDGTPGIVDPEPVERGVEDRGVGLAHTLLARVDHQVEELVDRQAGAPRVAVLADVVGDDGRTETPGAHGTHRLDHHRAVDVVDDHAAEHRRCRSACRQPCASALITANVHEGGSPASRRCHGGRSRCRRSRRISAP